MTPAWRLLLDDHADRLVRLEDANVEVANKLGSLETKCDALDEKVTDGFSRLQQQFFELGEKLSQSNDNLRETAALTASNLAAVAAKTAADLSAVAIREAGRDGAAAIRKRQLAWLFGVLASVTASAITAVIIRGIR
jgi:hypothetical protein